MLIAWKTRQHATQLNWCAMRRLNSAVFTGGIDIAYVITAYD
jgi:hypothetical protein